MDRATRNGLRRFEQIRAGVERRRPECPVALAYLEHSTPDFLGAVDALVARGATVIKVVPLFLGAGGPRAR
jgi:sirohydrochlorin cobaltochelatase